MVVFGFFLLSFFAAAAYVHAAHMEKETVFRLETGKAEGMMIFIGRGGRIDGVINPTLEVNAGEGVRIILKNNSHGLITHAFVIPDLGIVSNPVAKGEETFLIFSPPRRGEFVYFCPVPGHREAGMEGLLKVQ